MKKIFFSLLAAIAVISISSCDRDKKTDESSSSTELVYNVKATADGQVEFTWFNGGAKVNGNAEVYQCNDTLNRVLADAPNKAVLLADALSSDDNQVVTAARKVMGMIDVKGTEGNYHLKINGYVKYGPVIIRINEEYPKVTE